MHVQLPSSSHIFSHTPVLPDPPILLLLPLPHAIPGVTAGGEPGWSWTTARRPHRGPRGGDPAREAALEAGPGSPAPRPARPTPQCAVHWMWGGGGGSGRPRMGGTRCVVLGLCCHGGRRFIDAVIHCGCQCILGGPRYSACRCRVSTGQGVGCYRGCLPIVPR